MQRFSCIIGPNGSGKSNVIDSMLFVFGYRAQKIRSKKLSVLIHNSDEHKDIQSCTVEVHFQKIIDKVRNWFSICNFKQRKKKQLGTFCYCRPELFLYYLCIIKAKEILLLWPYLLQLFGKNSDFGEPWVLNKHSFTINTDLIFKVTLFIALE